MSLRSLLIFFSYWLSVLCRDWLDHNDSSLIMYPVCSVKEGCDKSSLTGWCYNRPGLYFPSPCLPTLKDIRTNLQLWPPDSEYPAIMTLHDRTAFEQFRLIPGFVSAASKALWWASCLKLCLSPIILKTAEETNNNASRQETTQQLWVNTGCFITLATYGMLSATLGNVWCKKNSFWWWGGGEILSKWKVDFGRLRDVRTQVLDVIWRFGQNISQHHLRWSLKTQISFQLLQNLSNEWYTQGRLATILTG